MDWCFPQELDSKLMGQFLIPLSPLTKNEKTLTSSTPPVIYTVPICHPQYDKCQRESRMRSMDSSAPLFKLIKDFQPGIFGVGNFRRAS